MDDFQRDGYALFRGVFTSEEVHGLETEFDRIVAQIVASGEDVEARWGGEAMERLGGAGTSVVHTHNVQQYSAFWLAALLNPRFLEACGAAVGPDVVLHHTKLFQKPPERGAPFPMHQDWSYFPSERDTMAAAIIHVSGATDEMGCLRVVPGSHRMGRLENSSGSVELPGHKLEDATPIEAEPGDVLIFHYLTIHGSMPNRSAKARKTVLVQVHAGDDLPEPGHPHPYEGLVLCGFNRRMTRELANRP